MYAWIFRRGDPIQLQKFLGTIFTVVAVEHDVMLSCSDLSMIVVSTLTNERIRFEFEDFSAKELHGDYVIECDVISHFVRSILTHQ